MVSGLPPRQIERRSALSSEHLPALTKRSNCRADIRKAFDQQSVARCFKEPAVVRGNRRMEQIRAVSPSPLRGAFLIGSDESRIPCHVAGEDRGETAGRGHYSSGIPALRNPARNTPSKRSRTAGVFRSPLALTRAIVE